MPEKVDLFRRKTQAAAQKATPPDLKKELLAKATGKPTTPLPTARTGVPLLPTGTPVMVEGAFNADSLTDQEREALMAAGWSEAVELPKTPAGIKALQQIVEQSSGPLPPPIDPKTPPIKINTIPLAAAPPEKQASIRAALAAVSQAEKANAASITAFREKRAAAAAVEHEEPIAEVKLPTAAPADAKPAEVQSETGAAAALAFCPHCNWDLSVPSVEEPPYSDKMAFLQCLLGQKPFVKSYLLFNGNVEVTFRTLTMLEVDTLYKQTYRDRELGNTPTDVDFWERLNRYRVMLQLQSFRANGEGGFFRDLPDAYSKATNPSGTAFWLEPEEDAALPLGETAVPTIETWMIENVLKSDGLFRVVNVTCNKFNRLASKMEAMADNSDFWKPTGAQS